MTGDAEGVLAERKRRGKYGVQGTAPPGARTVRVPARADDDAPCGTCFAQPGEPCVSMRTGKPLTHSKRLNGLPRVHASRRAALVEVPKFVAGSNELTKEAKEVERAATGAFRHLADVDPRDAWRFDPPKNNVLPKEGAFVTFLGSPHGVEGAFRMLRPGHTYFAQGRHDAHGQYLVGFTTEHGPVNLLAYEYAVLDPLHLWHLVEEGALKFTPRQLSESDFGWQFFYCQSRGIPKAQALVMCLGSIQKDVGWFEPMGARGEQWWRLQGAGLPPHVKEQMLAPMAG